MTLKTRLSILVAFVVAFLIAAPTVVLYTAGYRWNFKKHRIEKIGILVVRSRPSKADVHIDGTLVSETPARLRDLLPDTYDVRVTKDGYAPWEKHLPVQSGLTTFAENIVLFRTDVPEPADLTVPLFKSMKQQATAEAARAPEIVSTDGFEIDVTNADGNKETITRLGEPVLRVLFYPGNEYVLYETTRSIHAIERDGRDARNDAELVSGTGIEDMLVADNGKTLYFLSKKDGVQTVLKKPLQ